MREPKTAAMNEERALWDAGYRRIVGLDEAGRGPWAGPVMAAAVCLPANAPDLQQRLAGVRDSKEMTPRQRVRLAEVIQQTAQAWGIGAATTDEIDRFNIRRAACMAMNRALEDLKARVPDFQWDYLLCDSIKWEEQQGNTQYKSLVHGDKLSLTIAAASVLAKVERDEYMRRLDGNPALARYEFSAHKGYGTAKHRRALEAFGVSEVHRHTFNPIRAMLEAKK